MFLLSKEFLVVKKTKKKGRGVFALKDIEAGTVIGDYLGRIISDEEGKKLEKEHGLYEMYYSEGSSIFPDLDRPGVHLLNNSCEPNCEAIPHLEHVLYFAQRKIFKGEELTINYFVDPPEDDDEHTYPCECDSALCRGVMHVSKKRAKEMEEFLARVGKEGKKAEVLAVGQYLPPLDKYPKKIKDYPVFDIFGYRKAAPLVCEDKALPKKNELRKRIRQSGRCLNFKNLKLRVLGIMNSLVITY